MCIKIIFGTHCSGVRSVKQIRFDNKSCGFILRQTYGLPCICELARYGPRMIPLPKIHIIWTRLTISNILSNDPQVDLCIQKVIDLVLNHFKVDIVGKMSVKHKLLEIDCPAITSMIPPMHK